MTDSTAAEQPSTSHKQTGLHPGQWRLSRIEVVNWGTFDGFHRIDTARKGHLITGASGSGKSSLLDAITAVLTPDRLSRFNAAAQDGSSRGEDRSPISYVRGAWSKEADDLEDRAVSRFLRPRATWSGILLRYQNFRDDPIYVIRLFHIPGTSINSSDLKDALILTRTASSLKDMAPFAAKGIQARQIKAAYPDATVSTTTHTGFYSRMRKVLGIGSESAQLLLHKTQSAKNLGNLDHLFRTFMLDRPPTFSQAATATEQFRELNAAHVHVVDLRQQSEQLTKMERGATLYERETRALGELRRLDAAREVFQDRFQRTLAEARRSELVTELARATETELQARARTEEADRVLEDARRNEQRLGGGDLDLIRGSIADADRALEQVTDRVRRTRLELDQVGISSMPETAAEFAEFQESARAQLTQIVQTPQDYELNHRYAEAKNRVSSLETELQALRNSQSNIEPRLLLWRKRLCQELGVSEKSLPFGGELLDVREEFADWTGALERVLKPLASTLLVRDTQLAQVRKFLEHQHLGTRLTYEAIPSEDPTVHPVRTAQSLVHRVVVAPGPFGRWMQARLSSAYDYVCVDRLDDLDRVERGVTIGGQVKTSARRYEKNDRHDVHDRLHWIMGSSNEAKVDFLLAQLQEAKKVLLRVQAELEELLRTVQHMGAYNSVLRRLIATEWSEFDTSTAQNTLASRQRELDRATAHRPELEQASRAVDDAKLAKESQNDRYREASTATARYADKLSEVELLIARLTEQLEGTQLNESESIELEARFRSVQRSIDFENVERIGNTVAKALRSGIDEIAHRQRAAASEFEREAAHYRLHWEAAAASLTASIEDRAGYLEILESIRSRGLPEYEKQFRDLLREKSRDLIGHLLSEIRDAPAQVRERIDPVNESLRHSPYDADRVLHIEVKIRRSPEATQFMAELKSIVDGSWAEEDDRAEDRFLDMKRIMDRLESAENGHYADRQWRQRCLDTREHVTFLAHEKDAAGISRNVHESSAGLSGGQRQKLVSFCLAAALRYQLTEDEADVPTYATIVMDEAFDKADANFTRTVMDVFVAFGFHMILATPQKLLQTIESYIGGLTAVSNPTRDQSLLAEVPFEEVNGG